MADLPPSYEQIINLLRTGAQHAANKFVHVDPTTYKNRLEICQGSENIPKCEFYENNRCAKCGCFMARKAMWEVAKCPIEKW